MEVAKRWPFRLDLVISDQACDGNFEQQARASLKTKVAKALATNNSDVKCLYFDTYLKIANHMIR